MNDKNLQTPKQRNNMENINKDEMKKKKRMWRRNRICPYHRKASNDPVLS
jgi:hypothetical protein